MHHACVTVKQIKLRIINNYRKLKTVFENLSLLIHKRVFFSKMFNSIDFTFVLQF